MYELESLQIVGKDRGVPVTGGIFGLRNRVWAVENKVCWSKVTGGEVGEVGALGLEDPWEILSRPLTSFMILESHLGCSVENGWTREVP